jgi:hypothetical protein
MAGAVALVRTIQLLSKKSLNKLGIQCCPLPLLMGILIVVKVLMVIQMSAGEANDNSTYGVFCEMIR